MKTRLVSLALAFTMIGTLAGCGNGTSNNGTGNGSATDPEASSSVYTKDNPLVLTIGFENGPTDSSVNCGFLWADLLAEKSDGRIQLEVYPSGEMGNAAEMFQLVQEGSLDMVSLIPVTLGNFDARLELAAIPGLFSSLEQGEAFDENGNKIKVRGREELAIAFQHEYDHLKGILFVDKIDKNNPFKDQDKMRMI